MSQDPLVSNGDKRVENGNYVQSETSYGRVGRSLFAHRGKWPGGRDYELGNEFWQRLPLKDTAANHELMRSDFEQALQDWVDEGLLTIQDSKIEYTTNGQPVLVMTIHDVKKRLDYQYPVETPWTD